MRKEVLFVVFISLFILFSSLCYAVSYGGESCTKNGDCYNFSSTNRLYCYQNSCVTVTGNFECNFDDQCGPNKKCKSNICSAETGGKQELMESCSKTDDCDLNLVCDNNVCKRNGGEICSFDDECMSNARCVNSKCSCSYDMGVKLYSDFKSTKETNVFLLNDDYINIFIKINSSSKCDVSKFNVNASLLYKDGSIAYTGLMKISNGAAQFLQKVSTILTKPNPQNISLVYINASNSDINLIKLIPITIAKLCSSDAECLIDNKNYVCGQNKMCVQCNADKDCGDNEECLSNVCFQKGSACSVNTDCQGGNVCDSISGICKQPYQGACVTNSQCAFGAPCVSGWCDCKYNLSVELYNNPEATTKTNLFSTKDKCINVVFNVGSPSGCDVTGFDVKSFVFYNDNTLSDSGSISINSYGEPISEANSLFYLLNGNPDAQKISKIVVNATKGSLVLTELLPIVVSPPCSSDSDCSSYGSKRLCSTSRNVCVECNSNQNCGGQCSNGMCVANPGSCSSDSDCTNGQKCTLGSCITKTEIPSDSGNNNPSSSPSGSSDSSTSTVLASCPGIVCPSNKVCYWNSSFTLTSKSFYIAPGTGMYCCAPWMDKSVVKESGNAICVGTTINPINGQVNSLIEGNCEDPDGDGLGTRIDIVCPPGVTKLDDPLCKETEPRVCKVLPHDLTAASLPAYGFSSLLISLFMLSIFYVFLKRKF